MADSQQRFDGGSFVTSDEMGIALPDSDTHYFFCSCHGKGPSDGETAVAKRVAGSFAASGMFIPYAQDLFRTIRAKLERGWHSRVCLTSAARDLYSHTQPFRRQTYGGAPGSSASSSPRVAVVVRRFFFGRAAASAMVSERLVGEGAAQAAELF